MSVSGRILAATAGLVIAVFGAGCARSGSGTETTASKQADHHLHLQTAELFQVMEKAMRVTGQRSETAPAIPRPEAHDAIEALDSAGLTIGLVISGGYIWGSPMLPAVLGTEVEDERERVRTENLYLADQVAPYRHRLVGACSVNPLADYAPEEVAFCDADERIGAFKVHLANAGMDFTDPDHVRRLRAVFEALEHANLPVVVHLRNRGDGYGAEDARIFIREVLAAAPGLPVQIAHMAGWADYDDATHAAMGAFVEAFANGTLDPGRFTFGLAVVVRDPDGTAADTARLRRMSDQNVRLAERIREIGLERIVYSTDWPFWPPGEDVVRGIARNRTLLREALPLTSAEMERIFANRGPMFPPRSR
jgi:predicted TIM-barrel fold metal-dependent hydrolase